MSPLDKIAHETLETSCMSERELLVDIHDAVRKINGTVKEHTIQLKFLWWLCGFIGTGTLTLIGLLAGHVL